MQTGERYRKDAFSLINSADYGSSVWSGSPHAYNTNSAWKVAFYVGYSNNYNRYGSYAVRLVRGGKRQEGVDGFFFCV